MATLLFSQYGEILWQYLPKKYCEELKQIRLGQYDWHYRCYVTWPSTPEKAKTALCFADEAGITVPHAVRVALEDPDGVVSAFFSARVKLSQAESYAGEMAPELRQRLTPFQQAGAAYAAHTRRCFIADPRPEDRRASALGAIHEVNGYPCILVGRANERDTWKRQIQDLLPDVPLVFLAQVHGQVPDRCIWFVAYDELERVEYSMLANITPCSIIIDHADMIKKPDARRSERVLSLARRTRYRYLLTDFPVNVSPSDLREPLHFSFR